MIYLDETYDQLVQKSYGYNKEVQDASPAWQLMRELYERNYVDRSFLSSPLVPIIPKVIHQVWVGGKFPHAYKHYANSWPEFHPEWEYRFWNDDNIQELKDIDWKLYNSIKNPAQKSDYLRYHILNQFGGLYVDTDFQCLKAFDDLLFLKFFTGISYDRDLVLYIGLIASIPHHPILEEVISGIPSVNGGTWRKMFNETGAYYFTNKVVDIAREYPDGVVAFPPDFFYPYPNNMRKTFTAHNFIKPSSYALHHWAVSWVHKAM